MKKFRLKIAGGVSALLLLSLYATTAMAGSLGLGVSVAGYYSETTGKETLDTNRAADVGKTETLDSHGAGAAAGALYIQYTMADDGFVIGYELMPGKVTLGQGSSVVSELATTAGVRVNRKQNAEAELKNHQTFYIETPGLFGGKNGGLYLMGGLNHVKLKTLESLGTGTSYPDKNIWGYRTGIGWKSIQNEGKGMVVKVQAEYNGYETVKLIGSSTDGHANTISADTEAFGLKLSLGFNF